MSVLSFYVIEYGNGKEINVSYDPTLTVREFILDFLNKTQNHRHHELFTFILGCKLLNSDRFLDKKIGDCIPPNGTVIFNRKRQPVIGCKIFEPSKGSKYITKEYQPGYKNLSYTKVNSGLNIQIKCDNGNCLANNTIIYVPLGYIENWYFQETICEYCKCCKLDPINFWLKDCNYEIKFIQGGQESSIAGIADGFGNFVTFNDSEPIYFLRFNAKKR